VGDLPLLRYFFSTEHAERAEQEVLVMLTPRVVRLPDVTMGARSSSVSVVGGAQSGGLEPVPGPEFPGRGRGEPQ